MRSLRSVVVVLAVGLLAACNQNNSANKSTQPAPQTNAAQTMAASGANAMMGNRPRLRRICSNDIARFCQGNQRIRMCLRQNMQNLAADCRTALQEIIEAARERRLQRMNNFNNSNAGNGAHSANGANDSTKNGSTYPGNNAGGAGAANADGDDQ